MNAGEKARSSSGDWLRQRRHALDLTQVELARQVGCSTVTLRKLEAEERRPSKQVAERLADVLQVASDDRSAFLRFVRGDPFAAPPSPDIPQKLEEHHRLHHNLPLQLTSFVGRETELTEVRQLLVQVRLVTLTGAGGSGKTRLALEAASGLLDASAFADGVWLVELAPLAEPVLAAQSVASALRLQEVPAYALLDTLLDHLRPRQLLLVLDNCEHMIQACADLAEKLLRACPQLTILATSREALRIHGEITYLVPTLRSPGAQDPKSVAALASFDAVRLFVDRAQSAQTRFRLTSGNAPAVSRICQQLDGIPLALELAAARVKVLGVEQMAARLADRFQLLGGGSRTALPRHQTLRALIDWSYDLLSEPERTLFRRLSVFAGGWTLPAAETVCAGQELESSAVLPLLVALVNKSLVTAEGESSAGIRYGFLETIRQYAWAKLEASSEADRVLERLAMYLIALEATFRPFDYSPSETDRLEAEIDNLRAALTWCLSSAGSVKLGLDLAVVIYERSFMRGRWTESRGWLEAALARADAEGGEYPWQRARALGALGNMVALQGDFARGEALLDRSLQLHQELGEVQVSAAVLRRLGLFALERGDAVTARRRIEKSLELFRELGDQNGIANASLTLSEVASTQGDTQWATTLLAEALAYFRAHDYPISVAWTLNHLGHVAQIEGDYARAQQLHEESLPGFRRFGEKTPISADAFQSLGETRLAQNDPAGARAHLAQALAQYQEMGDRKGIAWCLAGLAGAATLDEDPERAARLWGAAEALRQSIGAREAPASDATRERLMAEAREQLPEEVFAAAWAEGQAMTMAQAIKSALPAETGA